MPYYARKLMAKWPLSMGNAWKWCNNTQKQYKKARKQSKKYENDAMTPKTLPKTEESDAILSLPLVVCGRHWTCECSLTYYTATTKWWIQQNQITNPANLANPESKSRESGMLPTSGETAPMKSHKKITSYLIFSTKTYPYTFLLTKWSKVD